MTYKKLFSLYPKFQNVRYACSLQSRKMIGHFNLSKVNFTGCWFQVKIYFKAEFPSSAFTSLLHICEISFLTQSGIFLFFSITIELFPPVQ